MLSWGVAAYLSWLNCWSSSSTFNCAYSAAASVVQKDLSTPGAWLPVQHPKCKVARRERSRHADSPKGGCKKQCKWRRLCYHDRIELWPLYMWRRWHNVSHLYNIGFSAAGLLSPLPPFSAHSCQTLTTRTKCRKDTPASFTSITSVGNHRRWVAEWYRTLLALKTWQSNGW